MGSLDDALKFFILNEQIEEEKKKKQQNLQQQGQQPQKQPVLEGQPVLKGQVVQPVLQREAERRQRREEERIERIKKETELKNAVIESLNQGNANVKITGANAGRVNASNLERRLTDIERTLKTLVQSADIDRQQKKDDESVIRIIKPKHSIIARSHTSPNSFDEAVKLFMDMLFDQIDEQSKDEFVKLLKVNSEKVDEAINQIKKSNKVFEDIKGIKQGESQKYLMPILI